MKKAIHIYTRFDQPELLEDLVEKLARRNNESGFIAGPLAGPGQEIHFSSNDTYASGTVDIATAGETFKMPFITRFLFTCTRTQGSDYRLTWAASMS